MNFRDFLVAANIFRRLSILEDTVMAISDDLVAAVKAETDEATAAKAALGALQAEVADLQAKVSSGVDPAVITKAIADLGASAKDLASAIPAPAPAPAPVPAPAAPPAPAPAAPTP